MGRYSAARDLDLSTKAKWYVVANRTEAVIYEDNDEQKFKFVNRLENKSGAKTETELSSDKPGKVISRGGSKTIHHSLDSRFHKHEESAKKFARRIAVQVERAYREKRFRNLILAAEPH